MPISIAFHIARGTNPLSGLHCLAWSVIGLSVLAAACSSEDWEKLDNRRDRDIPAAAEDFVAYPGTRISYRVNYHPDIWKDLLQDDASGGLEEFEQNRSEAAASLLKRKLVRLGLPEEMDVVGTPVPNDGRNILLSMNFGPARGEGLYSVTFTARQGSLYREEIRSPTELNFNIDFMDPVDPDVLQRINRANSMGVDSNDMTTQFLESLREPSNTTE